MPNQTDVRPRPASLIKATERISELTIDARTIMRIRVSSALAAGVLQLRVSAGADGRYSGKHGQSS